MVVLGNGAGTQFKTRGLHEVVPLAATTNSGHSRRPQGSFQLHFTWPSCRWFRPLYVAPEFFSLQSSPPLYCFSTFLSTHEFTTATSYNCLWQKIATTLLDCHCLRSIFPEAEILIGAKASIAPRTSKPYDTADSPFVNQTRRHHHSTVLGRK